MLRAQQELSDEHVLCFVNKVAYFTNSFEDQWGDDWNDAPFEHNAGRPYNKSDGQIKTLLFDADLVRPNYGQLNSRLTAEAINNKVAPWLQPHPWSEHHISIYAGTTMSEFCELIWESGGDILIPAEKDDLAPMRDLLKEAKGIIDGPESRPETC